MLPTSGANLASEPHSSAPPLPHPSEQDSTSSLTHHIVCNALLQFLCCCWLLLLLGLLFVFPWVAFCVNSELPSLPFIFSPGNVLSSVLVLVLLLARHTRTDSHSNTPNKPNNPISPIPTAGWSAWLPHGSRGIPSAACTCSAPFGKTLRRTTEIQMTTIQHPA